MLEGHHEVWKHTVYFSASWVVAFMTRDVKYLTFAIIMTDDPLAKIPKDERTFFAYGTKVFTADG